jgi:hypothetical protein
LSEDEVQEPKKNRPSCDGLSDYILKNGNFPEQVSGGGKIGGVTGNSFAALEWRGTKSGAVGFIDADAVHLESAA